MLNNLFLATAAAAPQPSATAATTAHREVVVTASRAPVAVEATATSATVIRPRADRGAGAPSQVSCGLEAYVRAENLFDADYQDMIGFNTPGRTVNAGLHVRLGD